MEIDKTTDFHIMMCKVWDSQNLKNPGKQAEIQ